MRAQLDGEEQRLRAGRRVSFCEAIGWTTLVAIFLAMPYWIGLNSVSVLFYVTFIALTWRLSKAMSVTSAAAIAFTVAFCLTSAMVAGIQW